MKRFILIILLVVLTIAPAQGGRIVNLDFTGGQLTDTEGGVTDGQVSRISDATYIDAGGVLKTATGDSDPNLALPRFEREGLLVEGQATNLMPYSEDFDEWDNQTGVTSTLDAVGPNNVGNVATTITDSAIGSAGAKRFSYLSTINALTAYTFSVFVKQGTGDFFSIAFRDNDNATWIAQTDFSWVEGAPTAIGLDHGDRQIDQISDLWYRISVTGTSLASPSNNHILYISASRYNVQEGSPTTIISFGAQLEETPYATSYIPTNGSAVVRTSEAAGGTYGYRWTMSQGLKDVLGAASPSIGTMVVAAHMLQDFDSMDTGNRGIVTVNNIAFGISYFNSVEGGIKAYDGTISVTDTSVDWSAQDHLIVTTRFNSDIPKYAVASKLNVNAFTHSVDEDYDESFDPVTYLHLSYGNELPIHIKSVKLYDIYNPDSAPDQGCYSLGYQKICN